MKVQKIRSDNIWWEFFCLSCCFQLLLEGWATALHFISRKCLTTQETTQNDRKCWFLMTRTLPVIRELNWIFRDFGISGLPQGCSLSHRCWIYVNKASTGYIQKSLINLLLIVYRIIVFFTLNFSFTSPLVCFFFLFKLKSKYVAVEYGLERK